MRLADELAAELHRATVVDRDLLDAPADPVSRLEHEDVRAAGDEIARRDQPGEPGAEDEDVASCASPPRRRRGPAARPAGR